MRLRDQVLRGGAYLSLRQAMGLLVGLVGIVLLTRILGPSEYGRYAAAAGILVALQQFSLWGIDVYLVRREGEERAEAYDLAHTLLLVISLGAALLAMATAPLLSAWVRLDGFSGMMAVLAGSLPIVILARVPLAKLERALEFRAVALVELAGHVVFYAAAVALALQGWNAWAPITAWWVQHIVALALLYPVARYRPRLAWDRHAVRAMLGYGLGYSASMGVHQLRWLVNPLIVGRFLGAAAVAYVDLAIRLVRVVGFAAPVAWRLSIAAFARLAPDAHRLREAMMHGMQLQLLALGPLLVMVGWAAPTLLPRVFGEEWLAVATLYPYVALGALVGSIFVLHASVLYVLRRNWAVTLFHGVHVVLFGLAAWLLVPRFGVVGYGAAEMVALPGYVVIHLLVASEIGEPRYGLAGAWCLACGLALFTHELGWWALLGLFAVALWPATWRRIGEYAREIRELRHAV